MSHATAPHDYQERDKPLNLRNRTTQGAATIGLLLATTVLAAPQAMAASKGPSSAPVNSVTSKPLGQLGPLTALVIERLLVSDDVAASKFGTASPIEDPVREAQVLEQVRQQAEAVGVNSQAAVAIFRDQITASKEVQRGLFARWTAHPDEAPTTRPDLSEIRGRLDQLTTALLAELKDTESLRNKPVTCSVQLALAEVSGAALERLDTLHRQALRTATDSVCRPAGLGEQQS
ncbi:chorismate mutase-like protein [Streptomyces sp. SAI-135]|jgi:chorismate mutase|uniref:chorismate mutase n=1 Tax=unclassified Streptomyces TaxID=2593676 RepID=UPI002475CFF5|nr:MULTISPECIES: chorismate mutase [unclassified Streptomyces]MDH6522686.1 chorismate mutase-like protein [Streptomyces sp. SAI-090]MDH6554307.1 chorismate mutase-like protein [Streptomyces sp. SAI-041]MDH6573571.1 chorismate mutase-like protein [Streptomyces sp. SAI-117]MDH6581694.1 chorismate mutase-like protein [Streptomyces sp. SAI-133]MDH6613698.1 chorismate mutase-like protein [Streptomyces sp. SAI-135]